MLDGECGENFLTKVEIVEVGFNGVWKEVRRMMDTVLIIEYFDA